MVFGIRSSLLRVRSTTGARLASLCNGTKRYFSGMSTSGLSVTQIDIRNSVYKICDQFPDEYWTEKDR